MSHEGKKKHFILPQGKGVGERNGYCKSTNKQLSLSNTLREEIVGLCVYGTKVRIRILSVPVTFTEDDHGTGYLIAVLL